MIALAIDSWIFVIGTIVFSVYSVKKEWAPARGHKYLFWGLLQVLLLMGVAVILVLPAWYTAIAFGGFTLALFMFWQKITTTLMAKREEVYGREYWKKPGTRGKGGLFLYKGTIQALNEQEKILEANPEDPKAWRRRGELLRELGEKDEADKCLAKLEELGSA